MTLNGFMSVCTRFPPEPNGYLHIGHLKAMVRDFDPPLGSQSHECILRLDDTNPVTEKQEFVDSIINDVNWLGFKYSRITYTSDYFEVLYNLAKRLISEGFAYIDSTPVDQIGKLRRSCLQSPDRNRSAEESLLIFEEMKKGLYPENSYVLRLKIGETLHPNTCMNDPIAYTIKETPHYRTGRTWSVYPSYDFSHPIVDSLEGITHSYCTREFFIRRELYHWILKTLQLRLPQVEEFDRLNIEGVLLSKRHILKRVADCQYEGFDDPRLFTIAGLRNRGFCPGALLHFCRNYVNYTINDGNMIPRHKFNHAIREYYNEHTVRRFGIKDPVEIILEGAPDLVRRPDNSKEISGRIIPVESIVYIEREDLQTKWTSERPVWLRYMGLGCLYASSDPSTLKALIVQTPTSEQTKKCKAIPWLSPADALSMVVVSYKGDIRIEEKILVESSIKVGDRIQLERLGYYYCQDPLTLVEIIPLREGKI